MSATRDRLVLDLARRLDALEAERDTLLHDLNNSRQIVGGLMAGKDRLKHRVAKLEAALDRLFDHAAEVRGYADGWEWKYGEAWDEEMDAAREVLPPPGSRGNSS